MKNILIGISMLVLAFYLLWEQGMQQQELIDNSIVADENVSIATQGETRISTQSPPSSFSDPVVDQNRSLPDISTSPTLIEREEELFEGLANQFSTLVFTDHSGGIREVKLKEFSRLSRDYNMTHVGDSMLSLSFEDEEGRKLPGVLSSPRKYEKVRSDRSSVIYEWKLANFLKIERIYTREDNSTYLFDHKTILTNLSTNPLALDRVKINLGTAFRMPRLYNPFDNAATYLNVGYYNAGLPLAEGCSCAECSGRIDGEKEEFFQLNEMGVTGELDKRKLSKAKWACVNNQFFVNIIRPTIDLSNAWIGGKSIQVKGNEGEEIEGVSGTMSFPVGILRSQESKEFALHVYAGPKDYAGLASLGHEQKKVMQFGVFWWISEPFSWVLNKLHGVFGSYGLAIIVLTILVKLILWPLTAQATRSQKKMQSLQGPMSKLREKHKGNSQKLNQEMMKFYKEHKVNPFAGCWPILIQIPIFLGMFWMLRSAAELYGQSFLWANDLSEQDHVAQVQGFSLNVLPILMVITQWFQMKLNPMQMGPELSDAQRINAKMMRFMPFMFLIFLYFFSSALVLYWTIQNLMTILQTLITKKAPEPAAVVESSGDNIKEIEENSRTRDEVTDKEKRYRNLLGLKSRGLIDPKILERNYKERADNYSESKLEEMSASKRRIALDKKQRLERAHQFLFDLVDK
ncbi:MAG: YidC/Oxa1 family insertase periplasmic-domain containing protein [Opitutales bacterium]|nr:YidC/Oxa1 family insertase periplasmic-domain containing protein [Opitutales bacterium]MDG1324777.1 YidC/Oxa1 family insertase periplasmic-domain containing protein [Opitutales bacterium]